MNHLIYKTSENGENLPSQLFRTQGGVILSFPFLSAKLTMKNPNKVHLLIIFLINQVNACKPSKNA